MCRCPTWRLALGWPPGRLIWDAALGYVYFESESGERLAQPSSQSIVRLRRAGRAAASPWSELPGQIEERWGRRHGAAPVVTHRGGCPDGS